MLLVFLLVALLPVVDGYRSVKPFCEQVKALAGTDKPLYGFEADERLRGLIPFYTGRYLVELHTIPQVQEALGKRQHISVVTRDKGGHLERQLLATGGLTVIARERVGGNQFFVLLTNSALPGQATGSD